MEETDVGRVFAAAAPDTVPVVGDLSQRARALGRRRRARRAVMMSGGAGIAVAGVVGVVVSLGGVGTGTGTGSSGPAARPAGSTQNSTVPVNNPPSSAPTSAPRPSMPTAKIDDPVADQKVLTAVKAALPSGDGAKLKLYRAAGDAYSGYGAEFTMGQTVLSVSVGRNGTEQQNGSPTFCATDSQHCTKGTATLRGHQARWEYYYGALGTRSLDVYDDQGGIDYLVTTDGQNTSQLPGLTEMKGVGLNEAVASALVAAWPGH
jgi:hypothetical protein